MLLSTEGARCEVRGGVAEEIKGRESKEYQMATFICCLHVVPSGVVGKTL